MKFRPERPLPLDGNDKAVGDMCDAEKSAWIHMAFEAVKNAQKPISTIPRDTHYGCCNYCHHGWGAKLC